MPTNTSVPATYNPASVMLNQGSGTSPYVVKAQSVRSSGTGPFDAQYRQNLATYAGQNFARPNGQLSINPTGQNANWGGFSGGGNAPNVGLPSTLLQQAIGQNGSNMGLAQAPSSTTSTNPQSPTPITNWLQQYLQQGSSFGVPL